MTMYITSETKGVGNQPMSELLDLVQRPYYTEGRKHGNFCLAQLEIQKLSRNLKQK